MVWWPVLTKSSPQCYFMFACTWSLGASLDSKGRKHFNSLFRELMSDGLTVGSDCSYGVKGVEGQRWRAPTGSGDVWKPIGEVLEHRHVLVSKVKLRCDEEDLRIGLISTIGHFGNFLADVFGAVEQRRMRWMREAWPTSDSWTSWLGWCRSALLLRSWRRFVQTRDPAPSCAERPRKQG